MYGVKSETTTISGQSLTVSYLYDTAGRRIRMTYPDGFYLTYEYWGSGGLRYIRENGSIIIATYEYDAYSRANKLTFGNGVYRELEFDLANRVSDLDITVPSDSGYDQAIDYGFNAASQITSKVVQNELYLPTDYGSSSDYSVNGLNQITDETSGGSTLNISYDKNGNLTNDGVTSFGYDLFNRLTSTSGGTSFDYDATGRLYSLTSSSANTYFLYDGQALIGEYSIDGSGNPSLQRRYIHGLDIDTPIVWYEGSAVSNATRKYLVRDELGSVVLVANNSGSAIQHNIYDEYGVPDTGNIGRFQYTGQIWLGEAGLYFYKARVYNPFLGRFHQTDPVGYGDGLNMYAYVGNDPVNNTDPSGKSIWHAVGAAVGAALNVTAQYIRNDGDWSKINKTEVLVAAAAGAVGVTGATAVAGLTREVGLTGLKAVAGNAVGNGAVGVAIGVSAPVANGILDELDGTGSSVTLDDMIDGGKLGAITGVAGSLGGEAVEAGLTAVGGGIVGQPGVLNGVGRAVSDGVADVIGNSGDLTTTVGDKVNDMFSKCEVDRVKGCK